MRSSLIIIALTIAFGLVMGEVAKGIAFGAKRQCEDGWYDGGTKCVPYRNDMQRYQTYPILE